MKIKVRSVVAIVVVVVIAYIGYCSMYPTEGFWAAVTQPSIQQYEATQRKFMGTLNELVIFYSSQRDFMRAEKAKELLNFHNRLLQDFLKKNAPVPPQPAPAPVTQQPAAVKK